MRRLSIALILGLCLVTGSEPVFAFARKKSVAPDPVPDALVSGDATGLIEGCGAQPIVGFTYCRFVEGDAADQSVSFLGPPAQCSDPAACVFLKVFNQGGQVAWGGSIPKGQTRVSVPWKTLLGSDQFQVGARGFWSWTAEVLWIDPDGHDRRSLAQGDIVLRVYHKGYTPLDKVSADPAFVWTWSEGQYVYKMTAGLRAYVGKAAP